MLTFSSHLFLFKLLLQITRLVAKGNAFDLGSQPNNLKLLAFLLKKMRNNIFATLAVDIMREAF